MNAIRLILAWLVILASLPFVLVAMSLAALAMWLCPSVKPPVRII